MLILLPRGERTEQEKITTEAFGPGIEFALRVPLWRPMGFFSRQKTLNSCGAIKRKYLSRKPGGEIIEELRPWFSENTAQSEGKVGAPENDVRIVYSLRALRRNQLAGPSSFARGEIL